MDWKTLLAYITGTVEQELLLRNEYLVAENRILRNQIKGRIRLRDGERKVLADIGQKLGKPALQEVATIVKPDTIFGWHRTLVAQKFDGSPQRKAPGRPPINPGAGKELCKILADYPDLWRSRGEPELFSDGWRDVVKTQLVVAKAVNMFRFVGGQTRDALRRDNIPGIDQFL